MSKKTKTTKKIKKDIKAELYRGNGYGTKLSSLVTLPEGVKYEDLRVEVVGTEYYDSGEEVIIYYIHEETDSEYEQRVKLEETQRKEYEDARRRQYETLKKEFKED